MKKLAVLLLSISASVSTLLADVIVPMNEVSEKGVGVSVGQIIISESRYGLVFTPSLRGLMPGIHGFHVHQLASCEPKEKDGKRVAAGAAGGHFDPAASNIHGAPWGEGCPEQKD